MSMEISGKVRASGGSIRANDEGSILDPAGLTAAGDFLAPGKIRERSTRNEEFEVTWALVDGVPQPVEVRISSPTGVTKESLRQIARGLHKRVDIEAAAALTRVFATEVEEGDMRSHFARARRRHTWDRENLEKVAQVYLSAQEHGLPPREAVVEEFHIAPPTASRVIRLARDEGLIPEAATKTTRKRSR